MTAAIDADDEELRVFEAAALLGVGPRAVYELIETGQLVAFRRGHRIVIPRAAVERLRAE